MEVSNFFCEFKFLKFIPLTQWPFHGIQQPKIFCSFPTGSNNIRKFTENNWPTKSLANLFGIFRNFYYFKSASIYAMLSYNTLEEFDEVPN